MCLPPWERPEHRKRPLVLASVTSSGMRHLGRDPPLAKTRKNLIYWGNCSPWMSFCEMDIPGQTEGGCPAAWRLAMSKDITMVPQSIYSCI